MKDNSALYRFRRKIQVLAFKMTSPEFVSKVYFHLLTKRRLNLSNPHGFNEKIQWLKLYEYPFNDLVIKCTDKYLVREYVQSKKMGEYLNDILFVWDNPDDIEWDKLPNKFVLKCTHGCAYNIVCADKSSLDIKKTIKKLKQWMKEKFGCFNGEIHYNKIQPRIICEKFLESDMVDYKFYCFNGKPTFLYLSTGFADNEDVKVSFYNIDKTPAPFYRTDYQRLDDAKFPDNYQEMVQVAKALSEDFH